MESLHTVRRCFLGLLALCLLGNTVVSAICSMDEVGRPAGTTHADAGAFVHTYANVDAAPQDSVDGCGFCRDVLHVEHCCAHGVAPPVSWVGTVPSLPAVASLSFTGFHLPPDVPSDLFRPPILS